MKLWELLPLALLGASICWTSSVQGTSPSAAAVTGNATSAWTTTNPVVTGQDNSTSSNNGKGKPTVSTNSTDTNGGTNSTGSGSSGSSGSSSTTTQPQKGNSAGGISSFSSFGLLLCSIMVQLSWSC